PDTFLQVESPTGAIFSDDDGSGSSNASLKIASLPETGVYSVFATTFRLTGSGPYTLTLQCSSPSCGRDQDRTDDDQDGFSELANDCDDSDSASSPEAPELPANGRDDNCNKQVDEGCNDPATCDRPPKPAQQVRATGNQGGVTTQCLIELTAE